MPGNPHQETGFMWLLALAPAAGASELHDYAKRTWASFVAMTDRSSGLPADVLNKRRLQERPDVRHQHRRLRVLAALLPTLDPVTLLLEMVPLLVLYELSIQVARLVAPRADGQRSRYLSLASAR